MGKEIKFRLLQHRMILRGATGDSTIESKAIPEIEELAHKYIYEFRSTNDVLWRGHLLLKQGEFDKTLALLRETEDKHGYIFGITKVVPQPYTHWTFAQLRLLYAAACK